YRLGPSTAIPRFWAPRYPSSFGICLGGVVVFTLEALQARKGDSLILHFGDSNSPQFGVIDGGPSTVYEKSLKPRLSQLSEKFATPGELNLAFVMVSHIDDDHIRGILQWLADWQRDKSTICHIGDFWF